nr:zinc finger, CCHC-type [Tanacetum cinerariifolium]
MEEIYRDWIVNKKEVKICESAVEKQKEKQSIENACAVIQQEESQKDVFNTGLPAIETTALLSKTGGKEKCTIYGFKWHPPVKNWEKVGYPVWHHKFKNQVKQNQSKQNPKRTTASVKSGSNSFTFTSEQFENLMRNVLKDMKPGETSGDCTDDELKFIEDMINAKILEILPKITLPNGDSSNITHIGQVRLKNGILLKDVLCDLRIRKVQGLCRKIGGLYHLLNVPIDQVDAKL